jgi:hypothetical protein
MASECSHPELATVRPSHRPRHPARHPARSPGTLLHRCDWLREPAAASKLGILRRQLARTAASKYTIEEDVYQGRSQRTTQSPPSGLKTEPWPACRVSTAPPVVVGTLTSPYDARAIASSSLVGQAQPPAAARNAASQNPVRVPISSLRRAGVRVRSTVAVMGTLSFAKMSASRMHSLSPGKARMLSRRAYVVGGWGAKGNVCALRSRDIARDVTESTHA